MPTFQCGLFPLFRLDCRISSLPCPFAEIAASAGRDLPKVVFFLFLPGLRGEKDAFARAPRWLRNYFVSPAIIENAD
jgi:hypothetical protein